MVVWPGSPEDTPACDEASRRDVFTPGGPVAGQPGATCFNTVGVGAGDPHLPSFAQVCYFRFSIERRLPASRGGMGRMGRMCRSSGVGPAHFSRGVAGDRAMARVPSSKAPEAGLFGRVATRSGLVWSRSSPRARFAVATTCTMPGASFPRRRPNVLSPSGMA